MDLRTFFGVSEGFRPPSDAHSVRWRVCQPADGSPDLAEPDRLAIDPIDRRTSLGPALVRECLRPALR